MRRPALLLVIVMGGCVSPFGVGVVLDPGRAAGDILESGLKDFRGHNRSIDSRGYLNTKRPQLELTVDGRSWRIVR